MKIGVNLKINLSKLDKARLFNGAQGIYLDAQAFIDLDEVDQYGNNGMITQAVSKEERQAGTRGAILGNSKIFYRDGAPAPAAPQGPPPPSFQPPDEQLPF